MKKTILFILSVFILSSCGPTEITSEYFEDMYDSETFTLNMSDKNLAEIPDFSTMTGAWLEDISIINLSDNDIQIISGGEFDMFPNLNTLYIDFNEFKSGSDIIIPKTIKELSLSDNMLDDIDGFNQYSQLTKLNLNNNNLEDNNLSELGGFKYLGELRVEGNNISEDLLEKINTINNK